MARITIIFGILMVLLGVLGYLLTGKESVTALIPSFFGLLFVLLGAVAAAKPSLNKHMMHVAALLSLAAMGGTFYHLLGGGEVKKQSAVIAQTIFIVLAAVFLILCIRSFIAARRARRAA